MDSKNPTLQKMAQEVEAKVEPALRNTFQKIVLAGEKVMYSPQSHDLMLTQIKSNPDPAMAAGEGIAKLFAILLKTSKGTLNMKAAIPAMNILLCEALDFMEKAGAVKVTPELLATASKEMGSSLLQILGVTPDKLQAMLAKNGGQPGAAPAAQPAQPGGLINTATGA